MNNQDENNEGLSPEQIREGTSKRIKKYNGLGFLESYAMYMGVAQILEFGLQKLLEIQYGYDFEEIERWTMGRVARELKKNGLRKDFFFYLDPVIESRNYIAHEILANEALMNGTLAKLKIEGRFSKNYRYLWRSINELEQVCFLFDVTNENDWW